MLSSTENGPILYNEPNRTPAVGDILSVVIYIFIITIFVSFFLILPGIRTEKFPTFLCVTTSLVVTSIILIALSGTTWHVGDAPISAAYKAFSRDRIQGDLSVKIGLQSVNVTLRAQNVDINYNERFYWIEANQMRQESQKALERGLPYPILTVVEYLSQDEAGFSWSRQYRMAGYYSYIILWISLSVCVLMFILHCAAPKYGIYTMQCLGCLLLFTNFTYATLVPRGEQKLVIPFEGQSLTFKFGWNFWLVLIGGCLSLVVGTSIVIIDSLFSNFIFTTILDVDFDSHTNYYKHRPRQNNNIERHQHQRPVKPPFFNDSTRATVHSALSTRAFSVAGSIHSKLSSSSLAAGDGDGDDGPDSDGQNEQRQAKKTTSKARISKHGRREANDDHLYEVHL